ncbi:hypothetical protein Taro_002888 [Colocasia esculenta]|uniref:Uncharacterized protein n=1 Tax=Colocasia esculenta TaxID=4460 RepID=A0A843TIC7_COLES|nr:hypothetical protein [Colocasia esculenta]
MPTFSRFTSLGQELEELGMKLERDFFSMNPLLLDSFPRPATSWHELGPAMEGVYRFCHGSVDTPIDRVDTGVKCVDTAPCSVDISPSLQKTQLPDWDSVSTQPVAVPTLVSAPRRPVLRKWDSVSTHSLVVSTHSG